MLQIKKLEEGQNFPYSLLLLADPDIQMLHKYLHTGICYVAKLDNQIVGTYIIKEIHLNHMEIMNLAVLESFQRRGFGKKLLEHAIQTCKENGYKRIEICTGNSSIHQLHLYQKCGFRLWEIDHDYFIRNYSEEIVENGIVCRDRVRLVKEL